MRAQGRSPRAASTLVELSIGLFLFSGVLVLTFVALSTMADVFSVTQSSTRAHVDAERCLRLCVSEIRRARRDEIGSTPSCSGTGLQLGDPDDVFEFRQALGVDPSDPARVLWGDTLRLTFEPDGDELLGNGVDDDRDGRVDEGRVAVYRLGAPDVLVVVAAHDVSRFTVELEQSATVMQVTLQLQMESVIERAVRDDVDEVMSGGGPRARYVTRGSVTILN